MSGQGRIAIVGLGRMGAAAASVLVNSHEVAGWDKQPVTVDQVRLDVALDQLPKFADVIIGFLPSAETTGQLFSHPGFRAAFAESQAVFVDASTSSPDQFRLLAADLGDLGNRVVDAPILGRPESAGQWTIPVGGTQAAFDKARPVLEHIAARVQHVGALGSASTIKLLNNMMFAAINVVTAEAIGACEWLGVKPETFVEVVGGSSAATVSPLFKSLAPRMLGEQLQTVFTVGLLEKDIRLAVDMCVNAGVPVISAPTLHEVASKAVGLGLADRDSAALVELYRQRGTHD